MAKTAVEQQPASPELPILAFQPGPMVPAVSHPPASSGLIPLNTRLSTEISTALLTASMQRKIQRQIPATQQDIISEALTEWLRKQGFMA